MNNSGVHYEHQQKFRKENLMKKFILTVVSLLFLSMPMECYAENNDFDATYGLIYQEVSQYNAADAAWITDAILYSASIYGVDPLLITAIMEQESGFNLASSSHAGAIGAMQLMPATADMIGVNPYNPLDNIIGGTIYLKNQLDKYAGRGEYAITLALAAYNAGPGAVDSYDVYIPYAETQNYVNSIAGIYNRLHAM